jgi:hypothetical protein
MACRYCGSSNYGKSCLRSPEKSSGGNGIHKHTHDGEKCVYCGSKYIGKGCPYSPSGTHER